MTTTTLIALATSPEGISLITFLVGGLFSAIGLKVKTKKKTPITRVVTTFANFLQKVDKVK